MAGTCVEQADDLVIDLVDFFTKGLERLRVFHGHLRLKGNRHYSRHRPDLQGITRECRQKEGFGRRWSSPGSGQEIFLFFKVLERKPGSDAPAGSPLQVPGLDQEGFVHALDCPRYCATSPG